MTKSGHKIAILSKLGPLSRSIIRYFNFHALLYVFARFEHSSAIQIMYDVIKQPETQIFYAKISS